MQSAHIRPSCNVPLPLPWLQFLVSQVAQRTFLVAEGCLQRLEGGVEEYVARLNGKGKKKAAAAQTGGKGGSAAGKQQQQAAGKKR